MKIFQWQKLFSKETPDWQKIKSDLDQSNTTRLHKSALSFQDTPGSDFLTSKSS
jgi:hypothetical protein